VRVVNSVGLGFSHTVVCFAHHPLKLLASVSTDGGLCARIGYRSDTDLNFLYFVWGATKKAGKNMQAATEERHIFDGGFLRQQQHLFVKLLT